MANLRLFCLPHAGGSATTFELFRRHLPSIDLHAVELPGRGRRLREPLQVDRRALVAQLADELAPLTSAPYALFGHSLGARLAFELALQLPAAPVALLVAASRGPASGPISTAGRALTDDELRSELRKRGGTPPEVLAHPELMELLLPVIRADFRLCEGQSPSPRPALTCPIHVFGGKTDRIQHDELAAWRSETRGAFSLHWFEGGHFFVKTALAELCEEISRRLAQAESTSVMELSQ